MSPRPADARAARVYMLNQGGQLRQLYLDCLYGLLRHSPYRERPHKRQDLARMLRVIVDDERYDHGSQQFAGMILLEFGALLNATE
jgi:hypothetical protein